MKLQGLLEDYSKQETLKMQQALIDVLDDCYHVKLKPRGNEHSWLDIEVTSDKAPGFDLVIYNLGGNGGWEVADGRHRTYYADKPIALRQAIYSWFGHGSNDY